MTRDEFLKDLERRLVKLPDDARRGIVADCTEHFAVGAEKGKTDDEITRSLGSPRQIAAAALADLAVSRIAAQRNVGDRVVAMIRAAFAIVGLAFFNGIFVLVPFLMLAGFGFALWMLAIAPLAAGTALIGEAAVEYGTRLFASAEGLGYLFLSLGSLSLGALLVLAMALATKWLALAILGYLRLNFQIIKGRA